MHHDNQHNLKHRASDDDQSGAPVVESSVVCSVMSKHSQSVRVQPVSVEKLDPERLSLENLPNIYLVGPMGAGKTTIGKLIAKQLGRQFIDCDWYICQQTGADIPWIFEIEGEGGFRDRESKALKELAAMQGIVMATGGGAVGRLENRQLLKSGVVIYLNAPVDVQLARTKKDKNRPLLQQPNPRAVLERLYKERHPLYLEVADVVIETGRVYPKQMTADVLATLAEYARSRQKIICADRT